MDFYPGCVISWQFYRTSFCCAMRKHAQTFSRRAQHTASDQNENWQMWDAGNHQIDTHTYMPFDMIPTSRVSLELCAVSSMHAKSTNIISSVDKLLLAYSLIAPSRGVRCLRRYFELIITSYCKWMCFSVCFDLLSQSNKRDKFPTAQSACVHPLIPMHPAKSWI